MVSHRCDIQTVNCQMIDFIDSLQFDVVTCPSNWLGASAETDAFGKALIEAGLSKETISDWSVDPRVTLPGGDKGTTRRAPPSFLVVFFFLHLTLLLFRLLRFRLRFFAPPPPCRECI